LKLIEQILVRQPAIELVIAMQGEIGLELASEHRPDLVLLDSTCLTSAGSRCWSA
jgi:DNA-binding response OmpR family regulator